MTDDRDDRESTSMIVRYIAFHWRKNIFVSKTSGQMAGWHYIDVIHVEQIQHSVVKETRDEAQ